MYEKLASQKSSARFECISARNSSNFYVDTTEKDKAATGSHTL